MDALRLYDATRRPANWTEIVRPGQVAVFATRIDSSMPCDGDGEPFATADEAHCVLFDAIEDAREWCETRVDRAPLVRFDLFDHEGRVQPPLLTVVHASRGESLDASVTNLGRRRHIAQALLACGVLLMLLAFWISPDRDPILPGFIGLNMVLIALRLLWMNLATREVERTRVARLARHRAHRELPRAPISPYRGEDPR